MAGAGASSFGESKLRAAFRLYHGMVHVLRGKRSGPREPRFRKELYCRTPASCVAAPRRLGKVYATELAGATSNAKENWVPHPGRVSTCSSDPIAPTSLRQIASPRPELENSGRSAAARLRNG